MNVVKNKYFLKIVTEILMAYDGQFFSTIVTLCSFSFEFGI